MKAHAKAPSDWAWHYRTLSRLRDALARECDEHTAAFREPIARGGEDSADLATEQTEHNELLAALRIEEAALAEVDAALERIRLGTYGLCEVTGKPISEVRLLAVPWTRYSAEGATILENSGAMPITHA